MSLASHKTLIVSKNYLSKVFFKLKYYYYRISKVMKNKGKKIEMS